MDYFKEPIEGPGIANFKKNISKNQELYFTCIDYRDKIGSLIICPNCDIEYNSDVGCVCGYGKDLIYMDVDKYIEKDYMYKQISKKNIGNGEKIELIKGSDNLYFYNFHGRIGGGKAEIEISTKIKDKINSNKYIYQRIKLFFDYIVKDNDSFRGESEGKSLTTHLLTGIKVYDNKERNYRELDTYKTKQFLNHKFENGREIEKIIFLEILNDYNYNPDLITD